MDGEGGGLSGERHGTRKAPGRSKGQCDTHLIAWAPKYGPSRLRLQPREARPRWQIVRTAVLQNLLELGAGDLFAVLEEPGREKRDLVAAGPALDLEAPVFEPGALTDFACLTRGPHRAASGLFVPEVSAS